jgi:hypothetical protein
VVVIGIVVLGAVVLGAVRAAGAFVVATPPGAVVDADALGAVDDVADVAGAADPPARLTTTPTDVRAPRCGWCPSRLASGRPAVDSIIVIAPIAIAKTATAVTATCCHRIGRAWGSAGSAAPPTLRRSLRRNHP